MSWRNFWRYVVLLTPRSTFWRHDWICLILWDLRFHNVDVSTYFLMLWHTFLHHDVLSILLPRPRRGLRGIVFTRSVCLCVCLCVCVRPIFWYFISRLLEEISIWNVYRILIGLYSIHWKGSMFKVTGTVHYFLKVQSYHKNWAIEKFKFFS